MSPDGRTVRIDDPPEAIARACEVDSIDDVHPNVLDHIARRTAWADYLADRARDGAVNDTEEATQ